MPGVFIRLLGPGYVGIRYPSATGGLQVLIEERTGDTEQCSSGAAVWALAAAFCIMLTSGCGLVRHWLQPWLWALAAAFCITLTSGCAGLYNTMQSFLGIGPLQVCITTPRTLS